MNVKLLFLSFIMSACGAKTALQEEYDNITITSYNNTYSIVNKLLETQAIKTRYIYENGVNIIKKVDEYSTCSYKYTKNNGVIAETIFGFSDEIKISKCNKDTEETLYFNADMDTIRYSLYRYSDDSKSKLIYTRDIDLRTFASNGLTNDNYNEECFYNKNGIDMTIVRYDFKTKKKLTTYYFDELPYNEAVKLIPRTTDEYEIVCNTQRNNKDTVVNQTFINGILTSTTKTIIEKGKTQILYFDNEMKLLYSTTDLDKGGVTIKVYSYPIDNCTDSIYYEKEKEIRHVNISDDFKSVTTYKYDENGNIIEEVCKSKYLGTKTSEELINEMLEILRKNKANEIEKEE